MNPPADERQPASADVDGADPGTPNPATAPAAGGIRGRVRAQLAQREFARHFLTLITGTGAAQVLQIVGMLLVGRLFSPSQFGVYTAVLSVSQAILPLAALRYDMAIVLPKRANDARQLVRLATWINTGVAVASTLVMLVAAHPLGTWLGVPAGDQWLLWLVGPMTWLLAQVALLTYWLTRTKNYRTVSENKITYAVALSGTQIAAGLLKAGVPGLLLATVLGQGLALVNVLRRTRGQFRLDPDEPTASFRDLAREYRKMPLLNGPNALVDSARLQGIPLLIANQFSSAALGQFSLAWRLLQAPIALINGAISQIYFQKISVTQRGRMYALMKVSVVRSFLIGLVPFGLIWLLAPWLLPFVLGDKWTPAGRIARSLVPWLFLNFITSPISTVFVVARRQGLMLVYAIFFAAVPLTLLWRTDGNLEQTITWVAWSMTALLIVFTGLALYVARGYDRSPVDPDDDAEAEGDLAAEEAEDVAADERGDRS
ncbi:MULTISPECIES: lipopolysaccharide biosynthesis protein [Aestuariimicrobium]|uniref:lipopolysaccharide biosynthesis protein n=1 Tax=Aestuariimicrobium TaxID=396388 RepID=UPI0012F8A406|nr:MULTISPECIES: oligosaccharide flippase family protein [Aestuariimicrobium]